MTYSHFKFLLNPDFLVSKIWTSYRNLTLVEKTHVQKNIYKVQLFYLGLKNIPRCMKRHMGLPFGVTPCGSKRVMKFWGPKSAKNSPFIKTKTSACCSKKIVVNSLIEIATFQALKWAPSQLGPIRFLFNKIFYQ